MGTEGVGGKWYGRLRHESTKLQSQPAAPDPQPRTCILPQPPEGPATTVPRPVGCPARKPAPKVAPPPGTAAGALNEWEASVVCGRADTTVSSGGVGVGVSALWQGKVRGAGAD